MNRERLVFCVDVGQEVGKPLGKGKGLRSRLDELKAAVRQVVALKHALDRRHEFGLVALRGDGEAEWRFGFTSNAERFYEAVNTLSTTDGDDKLSFNMTGLLKVLHENFGLPGGSTANMVVDAASSANAGDRAAGATAAGVGSSSSSSSSSPPSSSSPASSSLPSAFSFSSVAPAGAGRVDFFCRAVVLFGRSRAVPSLRLDGPAGGRDLIDHPCFVWDVVYVHDPPAEDNCPQEILDALLRGEGVASSPERPRCPSYFFMVNGAARRAPQRLSKSMALLCVQPLHRGPAQEEAEERMALVSPLPTAERVGHYFAVFKPANDSEEHVEFVLKKYDDQILSKLFVKYGPEPTKAKATAARTATAAAAAAAEGAGTGAAGAAATAAAAPGAGTATKQASSQS